MSQFKFLIENWPKWACNFNYHFCHFVYFYFFNPAYYRGSLIQLSWVYEDDQLTDTRGYSRPWSQIVYCLVWEECLLETDLRKLNFLTNCISIFCGLLWNLQRVVYSKLWVNSLSDDSRPVQRSQHDLPYLLSTWTGYLNATKAAQKFFVSTTQTKAGTQNVPTTRIMSTANMFCIHIHMSVYRRLYQQWLANRGPCTELYVRTHTHTYTRTAHTQSHVLCMHV